MSGAVNGADERVIAVLEELLEKFGQQHAWITNVAAASIVQQAFGKLSEGRASLGAAQVPAEPSAEQIAEAKSKFSAKQTPFDAGCEVLDYLRRNDTPYYYTSRMLTCLHQNNPDAPQPTAGAAQVPSLPPHLHISEMLRIYDEKGGDWLRIAREVEERTIAALSQQGDAK